MERIPPDTTVVPSARRCLLPGGDTAVLLIHGYTDSVATMRFLGETLNAAGLTVLMPRLPGHGTNGGDFLECTADDWLRCVTDEYLELRCSYRRVYVAGLSMGALLAILLAARFGPEKAALAAPAVTNTRRAILFAPLLRHVVKRYWKGYDEEETDPDRIYLAREYWSWEWVAPAAEVLRLQRMAKRALARVESDLLIVVSEKDRTVPLRAAGIIEERARRARTERLTLKESDHLVVNDVERETVARAVVDWFLPV
jgi:carboxylesterase